MYIDTTTNEWGLSQADIMQRHPLTIFPDPFVPLEQYAVVVDEPQPAYNPESHKLVEIEPALDSGEWRQQWAVVELSAAELDQLQAERLAAEKAAKDAARIIVSRTQGLIALYRLRGIEESAIQVFID